MPPQLPLLRHTLRHAPPVSVPLSVSTLIKSNPRIPSPLPSPQRLARFSISALGSRSNHNHHNKGQERSSTPASTSTSTNAETPERESRALTFEALGIRGPVKRVLIAILVVGGAVETWNCGEMVWRWWEKD